MYDNLDSFRAEFSNCEVSTLPIEGLGDVVAVRKTGDSPTVDIYPSDTQDSLESFFGTNGDYFLISYLGDFPRLSYGYHVDGEMVDDILSISPKGSMFGNLLFNPNEDLATGTISTPIQMVQLTGENIVNAFEGKSASKQKTILIQLAYGETLENKSVVPCLDIMAFVDGRRFLVGRSKTDTTVYGTLRKKFSIGLKDNTKLLSFSFGSIIVDDGSNTALLCRSEAMMLSELVKEYTSRDYIDNINIILKMLDTPNKIYDTEVTI